MGAQSISVTVQVLDAATQSLILDVSAANGYDVVSIARGDKVWRRQTVTSPWVAGRMVTQAVLDSMTAVVTVRARSTTWSGLQTLMNTLVAAFENPAFVLSVNLGGGIVEKWMCEMADSSIAPAGSSGQAGSGSQYDQDELMNWRQTIVLSAPRSPILVA